MAKRKSTNPLLREAIADAKAVRETALANAKAALEEAFTPHLTSMLSARLREEDDYGEVEEINDPVPAADGHGSDEGGETDVDAVEKSSFTEAAVDVDAGVQDDSKLDSSDIATGPQNKFGDTPSKEPAASTKSSSDIDNEDKLGMNEADEFGFDDEEDGEEDVLSAADEFPGDDDAVDLGDEEEPVDLEGEGDMDFGGDEEEDDLDLEAIIRELEADMVDDEEGEEFEAPVGEAEDEFGIEDDDEEVVGEADLPSAADGHGSDEGGETDADAIEKSTFTQGTESQTGPISEQEEDDDEVDLEEILREIEDEENAEELETENAGLKSELKEYRDAVRFLRSKLNEVNLLNAKLLYTNKLFKNYNMDGRQKLRVVENFDRATTVREAKLVFATLAEAFKGKPVTRKRSITEGLASKRTGSTKPTRPVDESSSEDTPTILAEGTQLAARLKKLAGIR